MNVRSPPLVNPRYSQAGYKKKKEMPANLAVR